MHVVEDDRLKFTNTESRGLGEEKRERTKRVTYKTKNLNMEGERFYFPMEWLIQLS